MIIILASGYFYIFQDYISSLSFWEHSPFECPWTYMLGLLGFLDVPCRYLTFSLIFFMFLFNFVLYIKIFFHFTFWAISVSCHVFAPKCYVFVQHMNIPMLFLVSFVTSLVQQFYFTLSICFTPLLWLLL